VVWEEYTVQPSVRSLEIIWVKGFIKTHFERIL